MFRALLTYLCFTLEIPAQYWIVNASGGLLPGISECNQALVQWHVSGLSFNFVWLKILRDRSE
jgi:hypothetical protein